MFKKLAEKAATLAVASVIVTGLVVKELIEAEDKKAKAKAKRATWTPHSRRNSKW